MSDSLKFTVTFKKGTDIPKDPRVEVGTFVKVVKESIDIQMLHKKAPYKYFEMQFLQSPILQEKALDMASQKYSNSDIANVMTNVSQESGKKATKIGVFVNYTPKLIGSDIETDADLLTLSNYWVSTMSRHKVASIRKKVREAIINTFTKPETKEIDLKSLGLYADYLAVPKADTNVTTCITVDRKNFINSRFLPGSLLDVIFQDDAIDDIYLPEDLVKEDFKNINEYLQKVSRGVNLRKIIPVVIRKRITITNAPDNVDTIDIPLEDFLTNVVNYFYRLEEAMKQPPPAAAPSEARAAGEAPAPRKELFGFRRLVGTVAGAVASGVGQAVEVIAGSEELESTEEPFDSNLLLPAAEEKFFYDKINTTNIDVFEKEEPLTDEQKQTILTNLFSLLGDKIIHLNPGLKDSLLMIQPSKEGAPKVSLQAYINGKAGKDLQDRVIHIGKHFKNTLFEGSTGYVTSGGIKKEFKQPPEFVQDLDFFIYSEFDPTDAVWKKSTYRNSYLFGSFYNIRSYLGTGVNTVGRIFAKLFGQDTAQITEEAGLQAFMREGKSTPFKYLVLRAKKLAVRPVPLSETAVQNQETLSFIEPTYKTDYWTQGNRKGMLNYLLKSTFARGFGNRVLLSFTRVMMFIQNIFKRDNDYNANPVWLSLFHLLSARNFSCPEYFETILQIDLAQHSLKTPVGSLNKTRFGTIGLAPGTLAGLGSGIAAGLVTGGFIIPIVAAAAGTTAVSTIIPEKWYMSENAFKAVGRGNETIAGLLTVFFEHARNKASELGITGKIDPAFFYVTEEQASILTKKLNNPSSSEIDKNKLVNFEMLPSLLHGAIKTFPTTYNKPLGDLLIQYDVNRAKFLDDKPWEKLKDKKSK